MKRLLVLTLLLGTAIGFQQLPIPQYNGEDGNPDHKNQPAFCQNHSTKWHAPNCDCHATEENNRCKEKEDGNGDGPDSYDTEMNARCKVHCRKS